MNPDFHPIVNGLYLLLAIQLLLIALLQFYYSSKKQYALAFLCLILSMWFFRRFFWGVWASNGLLIFLIGGYKEVFIGPLIFFHLRLKWKKIRIKEVLLHFSIPILLYLCYTISRVFFPGFYIEAKQVFFWIIMIFPAVSYLLYFVLGIFELKNHLKPILISKVYKRINIFFYVIFAYYLFTCITTLLSQIAVKLKPESEFWMYLNSTIIYKIHWYIQTPLLIVVGIFMIVQGLTETSYFKKLFIGNNIHIEDVSPSRLKLVSERIKENFYRKKIYKDVNLTLEKTLDILDITKKELSYYLDKNKFANFSDFVNTLRVKEFKELIHSGEYNNKYDLVSIAYLAGFNSKATFYRVFKKIEGITPSKYVKQLL